MQGKASCVAYRPVKLPSHTIPLIDVTQLVCCEGLLLSNSDPNHELGHLSHGQGGSWGDLQDNGRSSQFKGMRAGAGHHRSCVLGCLKNSENAAA